MTSQYLLVFYLSVIAMDNLAMRTPEHRRLRLAELIRERYGNKQANFLAATEQNQGEISALLGGKKSFGEKKAAALESAAGIASGSLELPLGSPFTVDESRTIKHVSGEFDSPNKEQKPPNDAHSADAENGNIPSSADSLETTSPRRFRAALHAKGHTAAEIAAVVGVSIETASKWLEGIGPEITLPQAVAIQNTYGANAVWITKGKGEPGVAIRYSDEYRPIAITGWKAIPVVGMAQLGDNGHWADLEFPVGHGDGYVDFPSKDPDAYALKCEGDSMRPRIKAGEFVVIEPNHPVEPGDEVLVKSVDGRVMVKEFLYRRAGRTHLISVNDAHPPMAFTDSEIEKMHYVRAICRPSTWRPE